MKRRFRIPREGDTQKTAAVEYVHRSWPEATYDQIRRLFERGDITVDDIVATRPDAPLAAGSLVEIDTELDAAQTYAVPEVTTPLWGDDWVVVDKPIGLPGWITEDPTDPIRFMADVLGLDRDTVTPVWEMPATAGGPWLVARTPQAAARINDAIVTGDLKTTWVAITPRPDQSRGVWTTERIHVDVAVSRTRDGLAELQLTPSFNVADTPHRLMPHDLLDAAAHAGVPVIGDPHHGGYLAAGGMRLRLQALYGSDEFATSWAAPRQWWPDEPVLPKPTFEPTAEALPERCEIEELHITPRGVERIEQGHPWVLRNDVETSLRPFSAALPVALVGPSGSTNHFALIDGTGPVAARLFSRHRDAARRPLDEVAIRLDDAIGDRQQLFEKMGGTDLFRVAHGEADGLPGLFVDRIGPAWCVTVTARCARPLCDRIYRALHNIDPSTAIIEVLQPQAGDQRDASPIRLVEPGAMLSSLNDNFETREADLRFRVDLGDGVRLDVSPVYRRERRRAVEHADPDARWLDARCRTGAFCAAIARTGAHVTGVDPRSRYFDALDTTFELNGLPPQHRRDIADDVALFLRDTDELFDGILVDPTAVHTDDPQTAPRELLQLCIHRLRPGGWLFATRPEPGNAPLRELVEHAADDADCTLDEIQPVAPPDDFPSIDGFPEGDPFEALWAKRT